MSDYGDALRRVQVEFHRLPEVETSEGCQVSDKVGRPVVLFEDSRHADAFATMMVGLLDVFNQGGWVIAELVESHTVSSDLRDRICEQEQIISGLRKIVDDQKERLDRIPEQDLLIAGLRKTVSDLRRRDDLKK